MTQSNPNDHHDDTDDRERRDRRASEDDARDTLTAAERAALGDGIVVPEPGSPVTDADDPRLTAYALGELEGEDLAAVERWLAGTDEGRALVDETRTFAGVLREELATEDAPALGARRRDVLDRAITRAGRSGGAVVRTWLATAAAVLVVGLSAKLVLDGMAAGDEVGVPHASVPSPGDAAGGRLAKREGGRVTADPRGDALDGDARSRLRSLGYLDGARGAGGDGSRQAAAPESRDAPIPLPRRRQLEALGSSRDGPTGPAETSAEEVDSSFEVATGGSKAAPPVTGQAPGVPLSARGRGGRVAEPSEPAHTPPAVPSRRVGNALESLGDLGTSADGDDGRVLDRIGRDTWRPSTPRTSGESYTPIVENPFQPLTSDRYTALSTFGVDVDTASYSNARRYLVRNQAPPPESVRLEEFVNAFDYDLPDPRGEHPFSVTVEASEAPWAPRHRLVRIGLQADRMDTGERPASNLVFLLDVSGSMSSDDKLPLLVASMKLLVDELDERDTVSVVTYASGSRVVLPPTNGADDATIRAALDALTAGGYTHASDGIQRAYALAAERFVEGGCNRVILATDGDFNVGITEEGALESFIAEKARSGVFLTVLGFGTGNLQDSKAEILADRGNGHYAYIDSLNEAHKVLVRELGSTLVTVAKDVKLQVEFNPGHVKAYRLLGYENRALAAEDFRDDTKDAGEIGAGHSVTALYEVVPVGAPDLEGAVDLKYQAAPPEPEVVVDSPELLTVNLRYERPDEDTGREFAVPFTDDGRRFAEASDDMRWAASVASFGMVLRHSAHRGDTDLARIHAWASTAVGEDPHGDRAEFLRLVRAAQGLPGF